MTRHLSLVAFVFGLVTTTGIAVAASLHQQDAGTVVSVRHVQLQPVTITGKRIAPQQ